MTHSETNTTKKPLNLWAVYGICLFISAIFFYLFGFNSPIYTFNSNPDYQWFMTMGNGLVHGKIPYRDLFEHKGPIVYFVYAFACLFTTPGIIILIIEIICMSLFFFFAYRICKKYLNTFYSLIAIPILAFAIFSSDCRLCNGSAVEEFALPIYTYFLLCWLEFFWENKQWDYKRSLCLGLCFENILWIKFTLVYFVLTPMVVWILVNICRRQYRTLFTNMLWMLFGILIITIPILLFYTLHHAIDDLFYVYFYINLSAYGSTNPKIYLSTFKLFFTIGFTIVFLIFSGISTFTFKYRKSYHGWILLLVFLVNFILLIFTAKRLRYYYIELIPYGILGIISILDWFNKKLTTQRFRKYYSIIYVSIVLTLITLCTALSFTFTHELGRKSEEYTPLVVANIINDYDKSHSTQSTLFCYKIHDYGFYNAASIIPNNYFYGKNFMTEDRFPEMYESHKNSIINQTSDFIITELNTYNKEKEFLSQYYEPFTKNIKTSTFYYHKVSYFNYKDLKFVLLYKK